METTARLREVSVQMKSRANGLLRAKPALWAGIATGAGFVVGIAGRLMSRRIRRRALPAIIVISDECRA